MNAHLTPDELIDYVERTLPEARAAHLQTCDICRGEATELASTLAQMRAIEVHEPAPLFWVHFSNRVRDAVAHDAQPSGSLRWLQWRVLAPVAGLALLVFALVSAIPQDDRRVERWASNSTDADVETMVAAADDWIVLSDLVGEIDFDTAHEAGAPMLEGAAERAALDLTSEEEQELLRLLREELGQTQP
jgi:hypothetical protein